MNRLAQETSPYLQQHKENPVEWHPWGEEAFAKAREEDKPILLSIGYAACHWCHVMAHESFEDEETAEVMNRFFVNIKVDREERPDVDAIYMEAVQALSGHGGWPMTMFLTPEGRPFFGGTYFPRRARMGLPSFVQVLQAVAEAWQQRRDEVDGQAEQLTAALGRSGDLAPSTGDLPGREALAATRDGLASRYDRTWGGFGPAPKFPQPDLLELLLRQHAHDGNGETLAMVTNTLDAMASGGLYDHLGGGFHRYSVDGRWLVPHFEKMLYDQALLARVYLHAWQVTGEPRYLQVASETIDYVRRDLRHPEGGFFSSEDADSEGEEGRFYVWQQEEVEEVLGDLAPDAIPWWGVTPEGNFEKATILNRPERGDLVRPERVEEARRRLFEAREHRVRPGLDDKVLTEWNGHFLATLAEAAGATGRADWLDDARTAGEFLLRALRRDDGRWLRSWMGPSGPSERGAQMGPSGPSERGAQMGPSGPSERGAQQNGRANHLAYAADYAALVNAFTRLAEATGEARWVSEATETADAMVKLFWDDKGGGLFTNGHDAEQLITRSKDIIDNAVPSANGVAAVALLRLGALVGNDEYRQRAEAIIRLVGEPIRSHPTAFAHFLAAVDLAAGPITEVAVAGDRPDLVEAVQRRYLPNAVLAWGEPYPSPLFEGRTEGLAYVCQNYACQRPVDNVEELLNQLAG